MDAMRLVQGALGVAKFATRMEGTRVTTLGVARGAAEGTLRSEPPIIRMAVGMASGGLNARQAHRSSLPVLAIDAAYDVVRAMRTGTLG